MNPFSTPLSTCSSFTEFVRPCGDSDGSDGLHSDDDVDHDNDDACDSCRQDSPHSHLSDDNFKPDFDDGTDDDGTISYTDHFFLRKIQSPTKLHEQMMHPLHIFNAAQQIHVQRFCSSPRQHSLPPLDYLHLSIWRPVLVRCMFGFVMASARALAKFPAKCQVPLIMMRNWENCVNSRIMWGYVSKVQVRSDAQRARRLPLFH
jgi:hypothetical protein